NVGVRSSPPTYKAWLHDGSLSVEALIDDDVVGVGRPIVGDDAVADVAMDGRMRPVAGAAHVAMLHRIDVDVVDMRPQVTLIANSMLPEPALPDAAFTFVFAAGGNHLSLWNRSGESALDQGPAPGEIRIVFRQRPYGM